MDTKNKINLRRIAFGIKETGCLTAYITKTLETTSEHTKW